MPLDEQFEDLDDVEARVRRNLESVVADMLTVLRTDLALYVAKEARRLVVSDPDFAESLSNETVLDLKARATAMGKRVADEICAGLSDNMDFWFGPDVGQGEGKSFEAHDGLMGALQAAASATTELLEQFDVPKTGDDESNIYDLVYAPPAYFVNGKYPPGLAETFWKNLATLNEIREARREQDVGRRRSVQRHRWDTIEKTLKTTS